MNNSERRAVIGLALLYVFRMLGLFMVLPVLAIYVDEIDGASVFTVGLALGCYGLTQALLQIPLGMASDRWGRKPIIFAGLVLFALGSVVAATADHIVGIIIGRALQGTGAIASTVLALAADLTREEQRTKAMASIGASIGLSFAIALVLGPVVSASWGVAGVFWLTAMLAVVGMAVAMWVVPTPQASHVGRRETLTVPKLLGNTLRNRELLRHNVGVFVLHFVLMALFVQLPVLLETSGLGRGEHGKLYLPLLLVSFLVAYPLMMWAERRRQLKHAFVFALLTMVAAVLLLLLAGLQWLSGLVVLAVALLLFFVAFNWLEATLPSLVSKLAPAGGKGTAMGLYSSSQFMGAFVGGAGGGALSAALGAPGLFAVVGLMVLLWLLLIFRMPQPRSLKRVVTRVQTAEQARRYEQLSGVEDVVYVAQEDTLYLKVDMDTVDRQQLEEMLGRAI